MSPFSQLERTTLDPFGDDVQQRSPASKQATLTDGSFKLTNFFSDVKQLGLGGHFPETDEQSVGIVGARRSFGMVLHAENRPRTMAQSLDGLVIEVDAVNLDFLGKCR